MNLKQIIPEQPQPSETQSSVQSETDRLMMSLNNENKTLHETNKELSEKTEQLQKKIESLNTELTEKEKDIRELKNRKPFSAPVETRVEYKTEYIRKDKCINCQINIITDKYKNLRRKTIYLVIYTALMAFISIMKNNVLKDDIVTFTQTIKNSMVAFIKSILEMCFSSGEQIMTATASNSRAVYWITSMLFLLLVIGFIGGILFYLIKNLILFFKTYWNFTQTAVTIIIFSLLICFADVLDIKGSLKLNLIVSFMIADMAVMVIRAVYDCIKNW